MEFPSIIYYPVLFATGFIGGSLINIYAAGSGLTEKTYSRNRTLFTNLFCAFGLCFLFYWEVQCQALLPNGVKPESYFDVFTRFAAHSVFFAFLLAASLIDWDDMVIPEQLTSFGTIFGIAAATAFPAILLPSMQMKYEYAATVPAQYEIHSIVLPQVQPLYVSSPNPSEKIFFQDGKHYGGVMIALWLFWCFAMLPRVWYRKMPLRKRIAVFFRYLYRVPTTKYYIAAAFAGTLLITVIAVSSMAITTEHHAALLSSLTGTAAGMCIIWATRIIAGSVLKQEAMGFGDVTLMGMIGAFAGWQPTLMIFFLAPLTGIVLMIFNAFAGRIRAFPYGPNLCFATVIIFLAWKPVWAAAAPLYFDLGWYLALIMFICLIMLGILLAVWCQIRRIVFRI